MEDFLEKKLKDFGNAPIISTIKFAVIIMFILFLINIVGTFFGYFGEAASVAKKEFGPQSALTKYEWFIETSNQLKKKQSDILVYQDKINKMNCDEIHDRLTGEACMTWYQELAGVKSSYNDLVAEYNSQSQKFNWSMFNTKNIQTTYNTK